ncbi:MAG: type II secretion system protein [Cyanobacteria bacterium SIG32]|nr:type II secretion system protein [Cyanobacteria bacterium SIG32]
MTRKFGFTLAEVLITLAIIGIVAAMTIPTLITEYKEKQTISQLLKVYATLSHAFKMAEAEHGSLETWGLNHTYHSKTDENGNPVNDYSAMTIVANRIMPYLKVAKVCVDGEICDSRDTYSLSGEFVGSGSTSTTYNGGVFFLQDGTRIGMGWYYADAKPFMDMGVTLPGDKIIAGKNNFIFRAYPGKIEPEGIPKNDTHTASGHSFEDLCKTTASGRYCTAWVIYNKNMDYLHCDDLSWNGKHKCSD